MPEEHRRTHRESHDKSHNQQHGEQGQKEHPGDEDIENAFGRPACPAVSAVPFRQCATIRFARRSTLQMRALVQVITLSRAEDDGSRLADWDNFVAGATNGPLMQTTRWARYKQRAGWRPILVSSCLEGSLAAVCMVLHRSVAGLPIGGILYAPRGPVLNYDLADAPELFSTVLSRLIRVARRRFAMVRVSPDVRQTTAWVRDMLLEKGFSQARHPIQHTATSRLDLTRSIDDIFAGIHRKRRSQIRQYERVKGDWVFQLDNSLHCLGSFYTLYRQTMTAAGQDAKSLDDISLMHNCLSPCGSSLVFLVKHHNIPVAGAVIVAIGKRLWYLYGGSLKDDQTVSGAGLVLHWEIIKWAKNQGYAEYDLQGLPRVIGPDDPMYGIYHFKQAWGGESVQLIGEYDYAPYPLLGKFIERRLQHGTGHMG